MNPDSWILKFDELRAAKRWTALGPEGRIGDFETEQEALQALDAAFDGFAIPVGDGEAEAFGRWWVVRFSKRRHQCKICKATVYLRWMRVCAKHDHRQCQSGKLTEGPTNERCRNVIGENERLCHLHGHRDTFEGG